jgi:hypothetical protein
MKKLVRQRTDESLIDEWYDPQMGHIRLFGSESGFCRAAITDEFNMGYDGDGYGIIDSFDIAKSEWRKDNPDKYDINVIALFPEKD